MFYMKKNYFEPYKKIVINWSENGISYKHYHEKMVITKDKITFKRTVDLKDDTVNEVFNTTKWNIKFYSITIIIKNIIDISVLFKAFNERIKQRLVIWIATHQILINKVMC